jgi:hypothetical protein
LVLGEIQCAGVTQGESHKRLPYFRRGGSGAAVLVQIASFRGSPEGLAVGVLGLVPNRGISFFRGILAGR